MDYTRSRNMEEVMSEYIQFWSLGTDRRILAVQNNIIPCVMLAREAIKYSI
jgi:hypothetical protein